MDWSIEDEHAVFRISYYICTMAHSPMPVFFSKYSSIMSRKTSASFPCTMIERHNANIVPLVDHVLILTITLPPSRLLIVKVHIALILQLGDCIRLIIHLRVLF